MYPDSAFAKAVQGKIGAFIWGGFMSAGQTIDFYRSEVFQFSMEDMEDYEKMLMGTVTDLLETVVQNRLPQAEGIINGSCTYCKYTSVCGATVGMSGDRESIIRHMLNTHFVRKEYKPLEFGGVGE
jgi:hypothetical protein